MSSTTIRFELPEGAKVKNYTPSVTSVKDSVVEGTTYHDDSSCSPDRPMREIAGKESHQVRRLRIVVMFVLLFAAETSGRTLGGCQEGSLYGLVCFHAIVIITARLELEFTVNGRVHGGSLVRLHGMSDCLQKGLPLGRCRRRSDVVGHC